MLKGDLRYPSLTGNWQLGDVDLGEHLDRLGGAGLIMRRSTRPVKEQEAALFDVLLAA